MSIKKVIGIALAVAMFAGLATDLGFLLQVTDSTPFTEGDFDTTYLDHFVPPPQPAGDLEREHAVALAAALLAHRQHGGLPAPMSVSSNWRTTAWLEQM